MLKGRNKHIFIIDFLKSGKSPAVLMRQHKIDELQVLRDYIKNGPPSSLALTDPSLFIFLRKRITDLLLAGWGGPFNNRKLPAVKQEKT